MKHTSEIEFKATGRGPLSSIKPLTVLVQVEDQRPLAEQDALVKLNGLGGGGDSWYTKKPVPLIVEDAFKGEISACGLKVVTDASAKSDASVKIVLKRFRGFYHNSGVAGFSSADVEVDAEIFVANLSKSSTIPSFQISGNYERKPGKLPPDKGLSAALADFIHNLTFDSRLVEALQ